MANDNGGESPQDAFSFFKKITGDVKSGITNAAGELREDFNAMAKGAEKTAASAVLGMEKLRKEWEVDERMKGAAMGAKIGALAGIRGGPVGLKICIPVGVVIGAVYGPQAIKKIEERLEEWKNKHRPNDNGPDVSQPDSSLKRGPF